MNEDPLEGVSLYVTDALQTLVNVHSADACIPPCAIHSPTDHHMREWPITYRFDRGIFERVCPHGIGHPDPDSLANRFGDDGTHGCDGCCRE